MTPDLPLNTRRLALRWTIGDVRLRGFEMLRLSVTCAFHLFGPQATYLICVNSVPLAEAMRRTGSLPAQVIWREVTRAEVPDVLRPYFEQDVMSGMGWKLIPLRTAPDRYELALDNDCILWDLPRAMRLWLEAEDACLLAEDADRCLGSFDPLCPPGAFNAGIRGLAPGQDLATALSHVLAEAAALRGGTLRLTDEIEEQGLQAAAVCNLHTPLLVSAAEVSICSPFWPRSPEFGTCGAHFVGMNAAHTPWNYYDKPADDVLEEHWQRHRPALYAMAGLGLASE